MEKELVLKTMREAGKPIAAGEVGGLLLLWHATIGRDLLQQATLH